MTIAKRRRLLTVCSVVLLICGALLAGINLLQGDPYERVLITNVIPALTLFCSILYLRSQIKEAE